MSARPVAISENRHRAAAGLEDVVVGDSAISYVGGETGELVYRGFSINALVPGVPFESVAYLLLRGEPPPEDPSREVTERLQQHRALPPETERIVDAIDPRRPPLDALRTILSGLGGDEFAYPPTEEQGYRLIARVPVALARFVRRAAGEAPLAAPEGLDHAGAFLALLRGERPGPRAARALGQYLVLLADHGMNASTFALRVVVSTESDLLSAATAALGALKGPLHGGAPSRVSDMLDAIAAPERAPDWIGDRLDRRERLFGFGHRAYKVEDPRAILLKRIAREVADPERFALALAVETAALDALHRRKPAQRLYTNVEYWGAVVLEGVGLPRALFTPTFAIARTAGWAAHAIEQANRNRLIRPDIAYTGPSAGRTWPRSAGR